VPKEVYDLLMKKGKSILLSTNDLAGQKHMGMHIMH